MAKFNLKVSIKHIQIDKANTLVLISAAITAAIVVFSIVASRALWTQMSYQNKVIGLRSKAEKQLKANVESAKTLETAYKTFEDSTESAIGTPDKNSKIVLDALPSKYDFPALATSLEGVITASGNKITAITGTDNEAQAAQDSASPKPIEMPFELTANGGAVNIENLIVNLERSIRPISISSLSLSGSDTTLQLRIGAITYYQPEKKLEIQQNVITNGKSTKTTTNSTVKATK